MNECEMRRLLNISHRKCADGLTTCSGFANSKSIFSFFRIWNLLSYEFVNLSHLRDIDYYSLWVCYKNRFHGITALCNYLTPLSRITLSVFFLGLGTYRLGCSEWCHSIRNSQTPLSCGRLLQDVCKEDYCKIVCAVYVYYFRWFKSISLNLVKYRNLVRFNALNSVAFIAFLITSKLGLNNL